MNARQKAALYTQLATLARAGIPLGKATLSLQPYFKHPGIPLMIRSLEAGHPISTGMTEAGFAPFEIRMAMAGEQTGRIEDIFQQLAAYWESEANLKATIIRQSIYPLLLLHGAVLALPVGFLLQDPLQYLYRVGINLFVLYAGTLLCFFAFRWCWRSEAGQRLILGIPVLGKTFRSAAAWRWIQVAAIEFNAGIPLPECIRNAWLATGWIHATQRAELAEAQLNQGESLSTLYKAWPELPRDWEVYLVTGENAGKLHESLNQLIMEAHRNWTNTQKILSDWIPRIFYAVIVILVAFQIVSSFQNSMSEMNKLMDM